MKKIPFYIISAIISMMCLTSCVTAGAMTETITVETEYYDYMNNVVVIYIDGIANYRYFDNVYRRYYYRPVPRSHFRYIRQRPVHHHHPHVGPNVRHRVEPRRSANPGISPRDRRVTPSHPSRDFGKRHSSTRVTHSRPTNQPNHSGNARHEGGSHHFGERR